MEFFALTAAELQRKDLAMWICDDEQSHLEDESSVHPETDQKPPGYYVNRSSGLFPAPMPQDSQLCSKVTKLFWFLGVFLAKTLQVSSLNFYLFQ